MKGLMTRKTSKPMPGARGEQTANYNLLLCGCVANVLTLFNQANIPTILFKGVALLHDVYDDPSRRIINDADLLIKQENFDRAKKILTEAGFPYAGGNFANAEIYRINEDPEIYIDLHSHLVNPSSPTQLKIYCPDEKDIWNRAKPFKLGQEDVFMLNDIDRLIYLSFHLLKERFSEDKWLHDIGMFLNKKESLINEEEFIREAKKTGTYKLCSIVIDFLRQNSGYNIEFLKNANPEKEFFLYRIEKALFYLILKSKIYPLRELLWIISMDSVSKKIASLKDVIKYIPRKL
jgi:hypothetical protein